MTRERVKEIADDVCSLAMNISWGKPIICEWDGDVLVFTNDTNAYESVWRYFWADIQDTCMAVGRITNLDYVEIDAEPNGDGSSLDTFRCGLKWKED